MQSESSLILVHDIGSSILLGFSRRTVPEDSYFDECKPWLRGLVHQFNCKFLTFDLSNIEKISNAALRLLFWLHRMGLKVFIYNPSVTVRHVLEITKLKKVIRQVKSPYS